MDAIWSVCESRGRFPIKLRRMYLGSFQRAKLHSFFSSATTASLKAFNLFILLFSTQVHLSRSCIETSLSLTVWNYTRRKRFIDCQKFTLFSYNSPWLPTDFICLIGAYSNFLAQRYTRPGAVLFSSFRYYSSYLSMQYIHYIPASFFLWLQRNHWVGVLMEDRLRPSLGSKCFDVGATVDLRICGVGMMHSPFGLHSLAECWLQLLRTSVFISLTLCLHKTFMREGTPMEFQTEPVCFWEPSFVCKSAQWSSFSHRYHLGSGVRIEQLQAFYHCFIIRS